MKKEGFSNKRIEESARTHDAISRAKAATPLGNVAGKDRLDTLGKSGGFSV